MPTHPTRRTRPSRASARFRFRAGHLLTAALVLVTAGPAAAQSAPLTRIAFGSCAHQDRPQPVWSAIRNDRPDLWIWLGDNVYNDTEDLEAIAGNWRGLAANPGYAALLKTGVPVLGTWDDHDFGRNDAGAEYPQRVGSQAAFLDFLGVAKDDPRRERAGVYHSQTFGPEGRRVQVIVLDTRYHRSALSRYPAAEGERRGPYRPSPDRSATMLGEAQWAWLEQRLREPAELRLICTSIQALSPEHPHEKWANLPREQARLMGLLAETGAEGVIFLSGDRHHGELSRLEPAADESRGVVYDLTSSGLNQSRVRPGRPPESNPLRVGRVVQGTHYGRIDIDWEATDPRVTLALLDGDAAPVLEHELALSELDAAAAKPGRGLSDDGLPDASAARPLVDGDFDEWPGAAAVMGTAEHLQFRFTLPEAATARRAGLTTLLRLDLDPAAGNGVDLLLEIDPPSRGDRRSPWLNARLPDGSEAGIEELDPHLAPTHAARNHEVRINRRATDARLHGLLRAGGPATVEVLWVPREGEPTVLLPTATATLPPAGEPASLTGLRVPATAQGAARFVAINVLWAQPRENPAPFGRVFRALNADVYLIQEWERDRYREAELVAWFKEHVDPAADWAAMVTGSGGRGSGTAVVTRHPLVARMPAHSPVEGGGWDFPARFAGAVIDLPFGRTLASSVHLKAGGRLDSPEDQRRLAEADAVNRLLAGMAAASGTAYTVFGGDFNLNGTPAVVPLATRGLDADGSTLAVAAAEVLGRPGLLYTHGRSTLKNRLDFITYPESVMEAAQAFVLDTRVLPAEALQASGLQADDTDATDHLPVVVDLRPLSPAAPTPPASAAAR